MSLLYGTDIQISMRDPNTGKIIQFNSGNSRTKKLMKAVKLPHISREFTQEKYTNEDYDELDTKIEA